MGDDQLTDELDIANAVTEMFTQKAIAEQLAQMPRGESAKECDECGDAIPEPRRLAIKGVRTCVDCQQELESLPANKRRYVARDVIDAGPSEDDDE